MLDGAEVPGAEALRCVKLAGEGGSVRGGERGGGERVYDPFKLVVESCRYAAVSGREEPGDCVVVPVVVLGLSAVLATGPDRAREAELLYFVFHFTPLSYQTMRISHADAQNSWRLGMQPKSVLQ